jgi:hypothetical protein
MINKKELKEIIEDLMEVHKEIYEKQNAFIVNYQTIFSEACAYQRGIMVGQKVQEKGSDKPTDKQIAFLKKNDYQGDISKLTFLEAKQLISEFIENNK